MVQARRKKRIIKTPEETWAGIFEDWNRSGQSVEEFCEEEQYSLDGFVFFYKKQFGRSPMLGKAGTPENKPLFVPLNVVNKPAKMVQENTPAGDESKIEISINNQPFAVRIQAGFDPEALRQVLDVLGGMSC